jgi:hypothetical protein
MKIFIKIFSIMILLFLTSYNYMQCFQSENKNSNQNHKPFEMEIGEELVYKVSYAFLSLGEIHMKVLDKIESNNKINYKAICYIDSYKGIPFVDLHEIYESTLNNNIFSYWFRSRTIDKKQTRYIIYDFDYPNKKVYFEFGKWDSSVVVGRDTASVDTLAQDGLSLFYFSRQHLFNNQTVHIPTIVNEKVANTTINFSGKRDEIDIDAVDYSVDVVMFSGQADFEGIFGFSGKFEGWFSNDDERVPIVAKMKVLIGKVRIELIKWTKKNWTPPKAK